MQLPISTAFALLFCSAIATPADLSQHLADPIQAAPRAIESVGPIGTTEPGVSLDEPETLMTYQ